MSITNELSPEHTAHLLERFLCARVRACVDMTALGELEERLAIEMLRVAGRPDEEVVELANAMICRAIVQVAKEFEDPFGDNDLHVRYANAVCRAA
jgi:hypothetical protein